MSKPIECPKCRRLIGKYWLKNHDTCSHCGKVIVESNFCPKCGQSYAVHEGDGSCVQD